MEVKNKFNIGDKVFWGFEFDVDDIEVKQDVIEMIFIEVFKHGGKEYSRIFYTTKNHHFKISERNIYRTEEELKQKIIDMANSLIIKK